MNSIYQWVQEKYQMYLEGKISEQEYYHALEFYEEETQIVDFLRKEDFSFLEPDEIKKILKSFEKIQTASSVREFIEQKYQEQKAEDGRIEEQTIQTSIPEPREPTIENIPQPPTLQELGITIGTQPITETMEHINKQEEKVSQQSTQPQPKTSTRKQAQQVIIGIIGSRAVGKTQLAQELRNNQVLPVEIRAEDGDYYPKREKLLDVNIIIGVYDITRPDTIFHLEKWLKSTYKTTNFSIPLILFGNKKDLERLRIVPENAGEDVLEKLKIWSNIKGFAIEGSCTQNIEETLKKLWQAINQLKENT